MLKNYFKVAFRNLYRNKVYTLINIFGLAVGLAATIMLFLYIQFELSFDKHFDGSEKIYKIISRYSQDNGQETVFPSTLYELADKLKTDIPEIENVTRLWSWSYREIKINNISKGFHNSVLADSCFLKVFKMKSLYNIPNALTDPNSIVLSESLSNTIFGDDNPIGKVVEVLGRDMVVKDVVTNLPENTHFKFDFLISINIIKEKDHIDNGNSFATYIRFKDGVNDHVLNKTTQYISDFTNEKFKEYSVTFSHQLQNIRDIHLYSSYSDKDSNMGNIQYIYIFSILAFFIILIAILNYINLFTAKSENRLKEVGIRKVLGASKSSLLKQFIGESIFISFLSFLIAMLFVESFLHKFGNLVSSNIEFNYSQNIPLLVVFILTALLVGALSGIYPSLYIMRFKVVSILKGTVSPGKNNFLKIILVIIQFSISIALISSLLGLFSQIKYLKNKDLGIDKEHIVVFQALPKKVRSNYKSIKNELLKNPDIIAVTASQSIPGLERSGMNIRMPDWAMEEAIPVSENRVQDDYINTYGIELIAGTDFSKQLASDSTGFVLNESAVKLLNLKDPIGKKIFVWLNEGFIKGVVKDFHFASLHDKIEPLVLSHYVDWFADISIRIQKGKIDEAMKYIEKTFKDFDPDYTQNYFFIDSFFNNMYKKEEKANKLILYASLLAIIISILGLLALTSFTVARRTKEIGIRKALGSNVRLILLLLNKDILKWVLVSTLIGIPVSYFFLKKWLQNFAYRIDIQLWFFIVAIIMVLVIALITITVQSYRTAKKNPTESLRYE